MELYHQTSRSMINLFAKETPGFILTFGDCCAYSSKWFLFSCSNKCLCRHYRRAFPKCEGEPKKGPTHNTQLCSQADRTYRNDKELGSITRPSSSSPM